MLFPAHKLYAILWFLHQKFQTSTPGGKSDDFSGQFFRIFEILIFCFVVAICDLINAVETMYGLP